MRYYLIVFGIIFMFLAGNIGLVVAENYDQEENGEAEYVEDNETEVKNDTYTVSLGDGQGSILIFGDDNTVYLPPNEEKNNPNEITTDGEKFHLVLSDTDIIIDGTVQNFSKLVFVLGDAHWDLVWWKQ